MCEDDITKTYLTISRASSCRCIGIARCLHYNQESLTQFLRNIMVMGQVKWEGGIRLPQNFGMDLEYSIHVDKHLGVFLLTCFLNLIF